MIERIEINLLPAEYRVHRTRLRLSREVFYPLFVLGIFAVLLAMGTLYLQNRTSELNNNIIDVQHKILQNKPIQNEINKLGQDKRAIQDKIRALERINVNREKWVRLMEVLCGKMPDFTWLVSVKEDNSTPPVLRIEGRTFSFSEVANYMSSLKESEYISAVDLSNIELIDPKLKTFKFYITATINPDAKLDSLNRSDAAGGADGP